MLVACSLRALTRASPRSVRGASGIRVRLARLGDARERDALTRLVGSTSPREMALVASDECEGSSEGDILGALVFVRVDSWEAHIMRLAVASDARRRGVATALVRHLLSTEEMDMKAGARVLLDVSDRNEAALSLYAKLGFRSVGVPRKAYYPDGSNAVVMERLSCTQLP